LEVKSSYDDMSILPSITISYGTSEVVKIFLQRYLLIKLCDYVGKTYEHRFGYGGLVFS